MLHSTHRPVEMFEQLHVWLKKLGTKEAAAKFEDGFRNRNSSCCAITSFIEKALPIDGRTLLTADTTTGTGTMHKKRNR